MFKTSVAPVPLFLEILLPQRIVLFSLPLQPRDISGQKEKEEIPTQQREINVLREYNMISTE